MHNSDNIINHSGRISSFVGVYTPLSNDLDLKSASQYWRTEASTQYEEVVVTLHGQKALGETYSSGFQRLVKREGQKEQFNEEYCN